MKTLTTLKENAFFIVGIMLVIIGTTALTGGFKHARVYNEDVRPIMDRIVGASAGMKMVGGQGETTIKMTREERAKLMSAPDSALLRLPAIVYQLTTYLGVLSIVFGCSRAAVGKKTE